MQYVRGYIEVIRSSILIFTILGTSAQMESNTFNILNNPSSNDLVIVVKTVIIKLDLSSLSL